MELTDLASENDGRIPREKSGWCVAVVVVSAILGLLLLCDQALRLSTTFDEATYIEVGTRWWRTGEQVSITKMGTPLTFWKLQQIPTLWALDHLGRGDWIDDPVANQAKILPAIRIGGLWIWLVAFLITVEWARRLYGPKSMAMAAVLFALSPNLLAHGALSTMETPLLASTAAVLFFFWKFLKTGSYRDFVASAATGGVAMSCKFTMVIVPPILSVIWVIVLVLKSRTAEVPPRFLRSCLSTARKVALGMVVFLAVMAASNVVVTGFARIPLSLKTGDHLILKGRLPPPLEKLGGYFLESPIPQDWVGFGYQTLLQRDGGWSYLLGERRFTGWVHYYPVTMAVKVPLAVWLLFLARLLIRRRSNPADHEWILAVFVLLFLLAAMFGSKRNFGFRYLLPLATPAIVWVSSLATGGPWSKRLAVAGLVGMGWAVASIHPYELSYFNELAGGPIGGRKILGDSNLDWGQGAKNLARLQRLRPEFRDITIFYFGNIDPAVFGVEGRQIKFDENDRSPQPPLGQVVETAFLAVSASFQWGPWGPAGYFQTLNNVEPVVYTEDKTIAIYRKSDLLQVPGLVEKAEIKTGPAPE